MINSRMITGIRGNPTLFNPPSGTCEEEKFQIDLSVAKRKCWVVISNIFGIFTPKIGDDSHFD